MLLPLNKIIDAYEFFKADYLSYPLRFIIETICWISVVINVIILNVTVPDVPWKICYPIWIIACMFGTWTAYTRKSFVGVSSCILYALIDAFGFFRVLTS